MALVSYKEDMARLHQMNEAAHTGDSPLPGKATFPGSSAAPIGEPSSGDDPKHRHSRTRSANHQRSPSNSVADDSDLTNEQVDQRAKRSKWPKDADKKLEAMTKAMPQFIAEYFGNEAAIASAMSVTPSEVHNCIVYNPELLELKEIAANSVEALLLDRMTYLALNTKSSAPTKFLLEKLFPDKYGRAPVASKGKGFNAPKETPADLPSVIKTNGDDSSGGKQ